MADELQLQFDLAGTPRAVMQQWKEEPPPPLRDSGYELADESYNSLTWEARYLDWPQKLLIVFTLGFALIFKGLMQSVFRLTARFDEAGSRTRVTLLGKAHPRTRAALGDLAAEHGGAVGLRVGA